MKFVYASTHEQEEKLGELIDYIYTSIFPRYFTDREIKEFLKIGVLQVSPQQLASFHTLKTAFQAMASMQVIISILEISSINEIGCKDADLLEKNIQELAKCGLFFPFTYQYFLERAEKKAFKHLSIYTIPANELLI